MGAGGSSCRVTGGTRGIMVVVELVVGVIVLVAAVLLDQLPAVLVVVFVDVTAIKQLAVQPIVPLAQLGVVVLLPIHCGLVL